MSPIGKAPKTWTSGWAVVVAALLLGAAASAAAARLAAPDSLASLRDPAVTTAALELAARAAERDSASADAAVMEAGRTRWEDVLGQARRQLQPVGQGLGVQMIAAIMAQWFADEAATRSARGNTPLPLPVSLTEGLVQLHALSDKRHAGLVEEYERAYRRSVALDRVSSGLLFLLLLPLAYLLRRRAFLPLRELASASARFVADGSAPEQIAIPKGAAFATTILSAWNRLVGQYLVMEATWRADGMLLATAQRKAQILDRTRLAVIAFSPDGQILSVNQGACMLLQQRKEELLSVTVWQLVPEASRDLMREYMRDLEIHGTLSPAQLELRRRDFTTVPVELHGGRISDDEGDEETWFVVAEDLTEKLKLREKLDQKMDELENEVHARTRELKKERDKVTAFLEQAPDMMFEIEEAGRIAYANRAAVRELCAGSDDLVGKQAAGFLSAEDRERATEELPRFLADGVLVSRMDLVGKEGRRVPVEAAMTLVRDGAGHASGARVVARSLAERTEADRRQQLLLAAMEGTQDGVIIAGLDGRMMHANAAAARMSGCRGDELLGRMQFSLCGATPEAQSAERAHFSAVLANGYSSVETTRWPAAEAPIPVAITSALIRDAQRMPIAIVTIQRDLTDERARQKRESAFRESLVRSEKLSALGELIAGVAHELNNPLGAVIGFAQLIAMGEVSEETQDDVQKLVGAAERCRRIVNNLLTFARKHKPERRPTDLNQVVRDAVALVEYEFTVTNIAVVRELDSDLPLLSLDGHQFQQVLVNMLKNSEQAIHGKGTSGTIRITTARRGNEVILSFEDDGPGIPDDIQSKVFDPFFTTKEVGKGTGLGLSITFGIVREHGGQIRIDKGSLPGACFVVSFPVLETGMSFESDVEPALDERERIIGQRILVVDDEEPIRSVVTRVLSLSQHHVDVATNAEEAFRLLERESYDCILCDQHMPGESGTDLLDRLWRRSPELKRRCILITGDTVDPDTQAYAERNNVRFHPKPFDLMALDSAVQDVLRENRAVDAA